MDPLSLAASIIAVAGALYSVSRKLRSCAKTIAYAAKEVKAIAKEISVFSILLRSLQDTYNILESQVSQAADLRKICKRLVAQAEENVGEFDTFLKGLKPLQDSSGAGLISKTYARVKWAFQKPDLLLLRSKLESSKSTLNLCMVAIQMRVMVEMYTAAQKDGGDEMEARRLIRQARLLKSQLHDQRSIVKNAVATSTNIEYLIRRQVRRSVNLEVANEALNLAKRHLEEYNGRSYPEVDHHPISVTSSDSSPRPGPTRLPNPPPSPRLPGTRSSPHQPPVSTRDAGRRRSTMAADMTPSGAWVFVEPGASSNTVSDPPGQGTHPMTTDVNIDMGYRTARTLGQRQERASRVRDADRNVVWTETHHGDDEGL